MTATRSEGPLPGWQPPPLPRRLTDPIPIALGGTVLCALVAAVLGVLVLLGEREVGVWFEAAACGVGVGLLGMSVIGFQSRARRRGDKGAQSF